MRKLNPKFGVVTKEIQSRRFSNAELAQRHQVSRSTITYWTKKAGLPLKRRGRSCLAEPNAAQREVIELSKSLKQTQIAQRFNISKQRVQQILKRWAHLLPKPIVNPTAPPSQLPQREVRERIICFRLTSRQVERAYDFLSELGVNKGVSDNAACRAVFLIGLQRASIKSQPVDDGKGTSS